MSISAIDAVRPAFEHAKQQLLRPFRGSQWAKLALVGFFAGELGSGGCSPSGFRVPTGGPLPHFPGLRLPPFQALTVALIVTALLVAALIVWAVLLYLNSIMRFVLFDSVLTKQCRILEYWRRRHFSGLRYFVWQMLVLFAIALAFCLIVGAPLALAWFAGWLKRPGEHTAPLILLAAPAFLLLLAVTVAGAIVVVLSKDFVVPQMALEDLSAFEAWRRLLQMIKRDGAAYAAYLGMKIVLALGAGFALGIVSIIVILFTMVPLGVIAVAVVLLAPSLGLGWNPYTITLAVVAGCVLAAFLLYILALISVPAIVFFPAYALYFFASRYPPLASALYPAAPLPPPVPPPPPSSSPNFEPASG